MEVDQLRYPFSITRFFVPEFMSRMRGSGEVSDKPSPRQSRAMCDLLLPAYLRKGYLSFGDLVRTAVSTSEVEYQGLAERLAYGILLEVDESEEEPTPEGDDAFLGLLAPFRQAVPWTNWPHPQRNQRSRAVESQSAQKSISRR